MSKTRMASFFTHTVDGENKLSVKSCSQSNEAIIIYTNANTTSG